MSENTDKHHPGLWTGIILAVLLLGGASFYWMVKADTQSQQQADDLARHLDAMEGHPTCRLANAKMRQTGSMNGRRTTIYKPETLRWGPTPVVACGLETLDGEPLEPLIVEVLCEDMRLECVRLLPQRPQGPLG